MTQSEYITLSEYVHDHRPHSLCTLPELRSMAQVYNATQLLKYLDHCRHVKEEPNPRMLQCCVCADYFNPT